MNSKNFQIIPLTQEYLKNTSLLRDETFKNLSKSDKLTLKISLEKKQHKDYLVKNNIHDLEYFIMIDTKTDTVIGLTGIYTQIDDMEDNCWLGWFCIKESFRGQGLSKELLNFSIDQANKLEKKYLKLYTYDSKFYKPAIKLYEKYNFTLYEKDKKDLYYALDLNILNQEIENFPLINQFVNDFFKNINKKVQIKKIKTFEISDSLHITFKGKIYNEKLGVRIYKTDTYEDVAIENTTQGEIGILFILNHIPKFEEELKRVKRKAL